VIFLSFLDDLPNHGKATHLVIDFDVLEIVINLISIILFIINFRYLVSFFYFFVSVAQSGNISKSVSFGLSSELGVFSQIESH
jgi:hypothetical protein